MNIADALTGDFPSAYFAQTRVGKYTRAELRERWATHPEERPAIAVLAVYRGWVPAPPQLANLYPHTYETQQRIREDL